MIDEKGNRPGETATEVASLKDIPTETQVQEPQATPAEEMPERYRGKSPKELVAILEERERHIGTQAQQLGDLQNQTAYYRSLAEQSKRQPEPEPQPETSLDEDGFWKDFSAKPLQTVSKVVSQSIRSELSKTFQENQMQNALMSGGMAKEFAKMKAPDLFKGREQAVEQAMAIGLQNKFIAPQSVSNPETWVRVAWHLLGEEQGFKYGGSGQAVRPVEPTQTETPSGVRTAPAESSTINIIDDDEGINTENMLSYFEKQGYTKEKVADLVRGKKSGGTGGGQ
jgi:hypothetical protein